MRREFQEQFKKQYGSPFAPSTPDYNRCAANVFSESRAMYSHQCSRKNGHGPHGAWCKQHDPEAVKARREKRDAEWNAEWAGQRKQAKFKHDCIEAIQKIADGHNDPRGLALSIIAERDT